MNKIYEITIRGKIEIDQPIDKDTEYSIALKRIMNDEGKTSTRIDKNDNEVVCYSMVNLDIATLISGDKIISGLPKKGSQAQVLRRTLEELYYNQYSGSDKYKDSEDFYQKQMAKIIEEKREQII